MQSLKEVVHVIFRYVGLVTAFSAVQHSLTTWFLESTHALSVPQSHNSFLSLAPGCEGCALSEGYRAEGWFFVGFRKWMAFFWCMRARTVFHTLPTDMI